MVRLRDWIFLREAQRDADVEIFAKFLRTGGVALDWSDPKRRCSKEAAAKVGGALLTHASVVEFLNHLPYFVNLLYSQQIFSL